MDEFIGCELLSIISIFDIRNNGTGGFDYVVIVVNCFQ